MKMRKYYASLLIAFILSIVGTITVSAAKIGDPWTYGGIQIGWWIFGGVVAVSAILLLVFKAKVLKAAWKGFVIMGVIAVAGLVVANFDVAIPTEPAEITPGVTWSVTASEQQGGNITIDNSENEILVMCHVNSTAGTILDDDDTAFTVPIINFTISPTVTEGLTDLELGATTMASVLSPDAAFTVSGTSYDVFSDVTGVTGDKDVMWTADGTDEYELHYCTVQFGTSEVVELEVNYNPAGISQRDAGTIISKIISIGGQTYTLTLIITGVIT